MGPVFNISAYLLAVQVCYFLARWVNGLRIFDTVSCLAWTGIAIVYLLALYVTEGDVPFFSAIVPLIANGLAIPAIMNPSRASLRRLICAISSLALAHLSTYLWVGYLTDPERVHSVALKHQAGMCAVGLFGGPLLAWWIDPPPRTKWTEFTARIKQ